MPFTEIEGRDASSAIRGYVYQVDHTIRHWINLNNDEVLELEKGEDIDIVQHCLDKKDLKRELEQIKFRESKASLNQVEIMEILLNFYLHQRNNPTENLQFRYLSNSKYTIESPHLFEDKFLAGIETWIDLGSGKAFTETDWKNFRVIQQHLLNKITTIVQKPVDEIAPEDGVAANNWKGFYTALKDELYLLFFIQKFHWSFREETETDVSIEIANNLVALGYASTIEIAKHIYSNLFLHVFKILSKTSTKRIDKNDLIAILKQVDYSETDQITLFNISQITRDVKELLQLKEKVTSHDAILANISSVLEARPVHALDIALQSINVDSPELVRGGTLRERKVNAIRQLYNDYSWIHFYGVNGTGKTQLGTLLTSKFKTVYWLDLRQFNEDTNYTFLVIKNFLSIVSNKAELPSLKTWLRGVVASLESETLLVLNDVIRIEEGSKLENLLLWLSQELSGKNIALLTTSNYPLQGRLKQEQEGGNIFPFTDFDFTEEELSECLVNNGAPENVLQFTGIISSITKKNPRLAFTTIQFLKENNWADNTDEVLAKLFDESLKDQHTSDIQHAINSYVKNEDTKNLLYRLSLFYFGLRFEEIQTLSDVPARIQAPYERLQEIVDVWVEKTNQFYEVSPLVYSIGTKNLPTNTQNEIYFAVGEQVLKRKPLNPLDISQVITCFSIAEKHAEAVDVLISVFSKTKSKKDIQLLKNWHLTRYWHQTELPAAISIEHKIFFRTEQLRIFSEAKDVAPVIKSLEGYLRSSDLSLKNRLVILTTILSQAYTYQSADHWRYLAELFSLLQVNRDQLGGKELLIPARLTLIISISVIRTIDQLELWLEKLEQSFQLVDNILEEKIWKYSTYFLCRVIVPELLAKEDARKQDQIKDTLFKKLLKIYDSANEKALSAIVFVETLKLDINRGVTSEEIINSANAIAGNTEDNEAAFIVFDFIGKWLYDFQHPEADLYLTKAINLNERKDLDFLDTLLYGACSVSGKDTATAVARLEYAYELILVNKLPEVEQFKFLSELGLAYWFNKEYDKMAQSFEDVINGLLKIKNTAEQGIWMRLFSLAGHVLSYISNIMLYGVKPKTHGEDYFDPYQGLFAFNKSDFKNFYNPDNDNLIYSQLAFINLAINKVDRAATYFKTAISDARAAGRSMELHQLLSISNETFIRAYEPHEALLAALPTTFVIEKFKLSPSERYEFLKSVNIDRFMENRQDPTWKESERTAISTEVIPLFIQSIYEVHQQPEIANSHFKRLIEALRYQESVSAFKTNWSVIIDLLEKVWAKQLSMKQLSDMSNSSDQTYDALVVLLILSEVYTAKSSERVLIQLVNVMPRLSKLYALLFTSVLRYTIIPFVKSYAEFIIKENFIGSREELEQLLISISQTSIGKDTVREVLSLTVAAIPVTLPQSRINWLAGIEE